MRTGTGKGKTFLKFVFRSVEHMSRNPVVPVADVFQYENLSEHSHYRYLLLRSSVELHTQYKGTSFHINDYNTSGNIFLASWIFFFLVFTGPF